jgi:anaerobic selenocysteine-containing dehydrogenase
MNVINACTRDCFDGCSMLSRVRDGEILSVEGNKIHPVTQGVICPRMKLFAKNVQSEKRIRTPLKRTGPRGSGSFEIVSWESALKEVAEKIMEASRDSGPSSVVLYETGGNCGLLAGYFPQRLINAINGSLTDHTICSAAGKAALRINFGSVHGYPAEKIPEAKMIALWGINSKWTNMHGATLVQKAKKKGASVWVIDPIRTPTSEMGRHLQIKPGTDTALALTIINHIVQNDMHDKEFIGKNLHGFSNLMEIAKKYDLNRAAEITGLKTSDITELATEIVSLKPSVIQMGFGLQRQRNGGEAVRAISLIPSIVGQHRGFLYTNGGGGFDIDYLRAKHLRTSPEHKYNPLELPRFIKEGSIKVLLVINSNPLATLPNQNALREALVGSDITIVTHDLFLTDTADYSDLVLPASSMFEQFDIVPSYFHDFINLNEKAISPVGDSKSNIELFKALARALGMQNRELFEEEESIAKHLLSKNERLGIDLPDLRKRGFARIALLPSDVYQTPSGKIEALSEKAVEAGLPSLPDHIPIKGTGHFQLLTPLTFEMNHSSYHLLSGDLHQKVLIHPDDATTFSIKSGDAITLKNQLGSIKIVAEISNMVLPGTLVSYMGFWPKLSGGKNINFLTTDYIQKFGGNSAYNSTFVDILAS